MSGQIDPAADYGMMLNDTEMDCCVAMIGHGVQILRNGEAPTDSQIAKMFKLACSSSGCKPSIIMWLWVLLGLDGHRIAIFAPARNTEEVNQELAKPGRVVCASLTEYEGVADHCALIVDNWWVISWGRAHKYAPEEIWSKAKRIYVASDRWSWRLLYWGLTRCPALWVLYGIVSAIVAWRLV